MVFNGNGIIVFVQVNRFKFIQQQFNAAGRPVIAFDYPSYNNTGLDFK